MSFSGRVLGYGFPKIPKKGKLLNDYGIFGKCLDIRGKREPVSFHRVNRVIRSKLTSFLTDPPVYR